MDEETAKLLLEVINALNNNSGGGPCSGCCECTTVRSFEASAVRANEAAAFAASESSKAFVQQNAAQFQKLLQINPIS